MRNTFVIILTSFLILSCESNQEKKQKESQKPALATWRAELNTEKTTIPFNFELFEKDGKLMANLINDTEKLLVKDIRLSNDSIFIPGYVFDSEIQAKIIDGNHLEGVFIKFDTKSDYKIPFVATAHQAYRIKKNVKKPTYDFSGKWEVTFVHQSDNDTTKAIGIFNQNENNINGTFLTATGDYRFLEGEVDSDELTLSTFDGSHAFVFNAKPTDSNTISGKFYSGKHWEEDWTATKNDDYQLPNPSELTYFNDGYDKFEFAFPDVENEEIVSSDNERFQNKVTLVQIMGSWCPNCMDEVKFLTKLNNQYPELEIVALAFEKDSAFENAAKRVQTLKEKLEANYTFLIAGTHNKKSASEALPMLNKIMSYPTTILIDKQGKVRDIHTGFSGPGTGDIYFNFVDDYTLKIKKLLDE